MLLTNWLKTFTSRLRRRPVFRSRDRRALRRHWQTLCKNQISTVEVLEDRAMLTAPLASAIASDVGAAENGQTSYTFTVEYTDDFSAGAEEDHPVNRYDDEEHWFPSYESDPEAAPVTAEAPPFSVSETFNLSSLAGANHTIYLDFNGHTTTGTPWNDEYGSIVTPAYDIDGNVAVFGTNEHEVMQRIWQRVAEDFAPFNVNVTTIEPPISDLIKSNASDTQWGVRVVIGENTWYKNAGGVAYVGSFNYDTDTPTFVFNTSLIGVAEAVSHEVGHTLGLYHDGTSAEDYYEGQGSGTTGWAPIMGVGYDQNLVQWSKGEYTDSNNNQDDLSIITTQNGFGYRADDHGSSVGTASTVTGGMVSGIVERNTDVDYFQFITNGGDVIIDPFIESPNLDILARLYDSGGTQIQTSNPVGALNASFTGLSAGTYYVSIEGTGEGSVSGTGYSDYGSLGQYTITFSAQIPTLDVISDMTLTENAPWQTVNLSGITAGIGESQPLRVMASSSNTDLVRDPMVIYTSPDTTGTLKFTPVPHQRGTATITVTVEDGGLDGDLDTPNDNAMFTRTFDVTVNAVNGVPTIFSQGELLPDPIANLAAGDDTGNAVAVDGDWMVVAAENYNDRAGIVYLYIRNDVNHTPDNLTDDIWDFHSTIYAPTNGVEPGYYYFGKSVAIDGDLLIIGAPYADDGDLAGSVYLYQLNEGTDPGHEDDVWVHQRTFTQPADGLFGAPFPRGFGPSVSNIGHSLAIQGQTIVVGSPNADVDETTKRAGAVYVFMTDDGWNTYSTSKLTASDATDYAYFGESVSISEDENTIIAGDPYHDSDGAVYLFSRDTSGTASPGDDSWSEFKMLTAVETDSQFGTSVDIENGIAVIGSNGDAYVIQESENWDVLTSLAGIGEIKPVRFGLGVAISGDVILVGGPDFNDPADPGSIYLFDGWNGWESPDLEQLYALDPNLNETFFTESIAISGRTIIAGWRNHAHDGVQTGAAYAYEYLPIIDLKADITDGSLVINNLTNQNASVSLSVSDGALVVTHPNNRLVPPVEGNLVNLNQFTIPLSALTSGEIYINGGTGNEHVSVDTSLAAAGLKVNFTGGEGGGFDSLELTGTASSAEYLFENEHDGKVRLNDSGLDFISYTGLEPITSSIDAPQITLVYSDADETITVSSPASSQLSVDSTAGEIITFQDFTGKLTLDAGAGINTLNLNGLGASLTADFEILDSAGTETVVLLGDTLDLGSGKITIAAETVQIAGAVTGAGDLEIAATTIEFSNTDSSLNTGDGDLSLLAENTIDLMEVISTGTVEITSLTGDINDSNDGTNNITASQAILSAVNGAIGNTLETEIGNLEAIADGIIYIINTGDLIIGGVSALDGLQSTNERVLIQSYGSIEVLENVTAYDRVLLWTQDSEIASLDEDILVHSGVILHSDTNYVALYSDDDLTIQEQATLETLATNIYLQINYDSADGVGGVLDLAGKLITQDPSYRTFVYGSSQADSYQIAPSLNSRILIQGYHWSQTETLDDELIYYIPEGESATLVPSSDVSGTISYTGGYKNINYNNVATLQQDDLQELAGHFRVTGTAADDVLTINATNANSGTWQLNDGPVNSFSDIESFTFVGLEGDDRLVINNPVDGVFHPAGGVDFIGGTGGETLGDTLEIIGGFVAESEFEFITENRGQVFYGGLAAPAINYFNLEELVSELSVTDQRLYYNIPDTRSLSISDDGAGKTAFNTDYGTPLKLKTPSETLSLQYGNRPLQASQYYIILNSLGTGFGADFVINDRDDNNTVILADGLHLGSADVTINTETVRIFGSVTGTGDLEIVATTIDFPNANSSLNITDGNLSLLAENTINLMEVISTGTVAITSTNGDINDNNDSANNITASRAILSAVNGAIGNTLETEVGNLEAVAYGSIEITNTGDLIIGGVGGLDGIQSTNSGYGVIVRSYGAITVEEEITSFERVVLLTLDSSIPSLSEDILIQSGVTLYSETSFISLYSDDDMTIKEQAELEALGSEISSNIYLRVNYDSADGVGGILDLLGQLSTTGSINRTLIYGSSQADSFLIAPSLDSLIYVTAYDPVTPESPGDQLIYYIPKGEVASINVMGTDVGTIAFSGLFQDIAYSSVETLLLAGSLTLEGTASDDVLTINATDANSGTFQLNDGPAVVFTDLSDLTFRGLEGDDRLVIHHPVEGLFAPVDGILFEGGDQTFADTLEILGGNATSVEHHFTNENDGSIFYNGQTTAAITYTGLEPVLDTTVATDRSFTFTGGAETITLSDDGVVANNISRIDSDLFGEVVTFLNATGNVIIKTTDGTGSDNVHIEGVDENFGTKLTIQAGTDDAVHFQTNVTDIGAGNVDIIAGSIAFASSLITTGNVNLVATAGSITDASPAEATLITADSAVLQATLGIGGAGELDIDVEVNSMTTKSPQGPITISNFGELYVQLSDLPLIILNEDAGTQSIDLSQITTEGGISHPLSVTAQSSNLSLILDPQVNYEASDDTRSLVFTPASEQSGMATITIFVTDGGADHLLETTEDNRTIELKFDVTVNPENDDPELDELVDLLLAENAPEQTVNLSGISAGGDESQSLQVTATSSNTALIPDPSVVYTSADATSSLVFTPVTDQTGTATITVTVEDGGLDGNLATTVDNAIITRTFDVTVRDFETVSLRVVNTPTTTDANGEAAVLPASQDWLSEWESYLVEIWVSTADLTSQGIATVSLDLGYQTDFTSATEIEYGSAFSQNQTGTIDDESSLIGNLSATTNVADLGVNTRLLFARIKFESLVDDQVLLDLDGQSVGPHDLAFQMQTPQLSLGSERLSTTPLLDSIGADIWANPFDLNDDDKISFRDLTEFAALYNTRPSESGSEYAWFADFNQNDRVDFRDLVLLASNYNKSKLNKSVINYPNNYPVAWNQLLQVTLLPAIQKTTSVLTQAQAETALQTAIDDMSLQLPDESQQQLINVKIELVDLKGTTLGRAAGNTIYLDIDAAGYGWFVDVTPLDHSEFQYDSNLSLIALPGSEAEGLVDLWTVIRHELGHLLGYEHQTSGLMEATLDPSVRKLDNWTDESDLFFASLEEDTELLSF